MNLIIYQGRSPQPNFEQMTVELSTEEIFTIIRSELSVPNQLVYDAFAALITNEFYQIIIEDSPLDIQQIGRATSLEIGVTINDINYNDLSESDKIVIDNFNDIILNLQL